MTTRVLMALLTVSISRLWLMPLPSSFWTDETETALIVQHPSDPSLAVVRPLTATWYYIFPRAAGRLLGFSEVSYRLPSVLLMGIALFIIGRLAARLIDPGAAWFAVFACLAMSDFNYYAADARPYALGICVSAAAVYFLVLWLDTASWIQAFLFVLFAALLWRIHLVFWAFYPVFPIATLVRLLCSNTRVGWLRAILVYLALALTMMPVALQALSALPDAKAHAHFPFPRLQSLPNALMWGWIALCAVLAWLSSRFLKGRAVVQARRDPSAFQTRELSRDQRERFSKRPASPAITLIALWWLWMPLCLFAFSRTIGPILFVPRYYSPALPGAALAATAAAAFYLPRARWNQASIVLAVVGLIAAGQWNVISPFIEAMPPVWSPDYRLPGYLYSPLFVYPVRGRVYPFPFLRSPENESYADSLLTATLLNRDRFIIYGAGLNTVAWVQWFSQRPGLARWRYTSSNAGDVNLAVFESPSLNQ